jgi:prevent-host-death family protein
MIISTSALRQNLYKLLDKVLETGVPLEIKRRGKIIKILPPDETDKLSNLKKRNILNCDPEELVHIDWSSEWKM